MEYPLTLSCRMSKGGRVEILANDRDIEPLLHGCSLRRMNCTCNVLLHVNAFTNTTSAEFEVPPRTSATGFSRTPSSTPKVSRLSI